MRAKNVGKNSIISIFSQSIIIVAGFFSQWVINSRLGKELVGLNGVVSNIIAIFSVSELGLSTAITYHLYGAMVSGDEKKVAALMNLFRRAYAVVALCITGLGILFLPFVPWVVRNSCFSPGYVRTIYGLWLARTVCSYLLSYKRAIVIADQREYISSLTLMAISVMNYLSIIIVVLICGNYVLAFALGILFELLINSGLVLYVNKAYPFLKTYGRERVEKGLLEKVFQDIKNLFVTRLSQRLLGCTDNLILSVFVNLGLVGLYSNYCLITQSLMNVLQALSDALQPTIGNLAVDRNRRGDHERFLVLSFLFFFIAAIAMSGFYTLGTLFVRDLWLGKGYELGQFTVFLCALNWTLLILGMPITVFLNVTGMFREEKRVVFSAAVVNLAVSLGLVGVFGLEGVLLGTLCACLIQLGGKVRCFYCKYLLLPVWKYYLLLCTYVVLVLGEMTTCHWLVMRFYQEGRLFWFLAGGALCVIFPACVNGVLFGRTSYGRKAGRLFVAWIYNIGQRKSAESVKKKKL